jgi:hypothetical protein
MPVLSHLHQLFNADAMPSMPEPPHWTRGHVPIPPRVQTLLVP